MKATEIHYKKELTKKEFMISVLLFILFPGVIQHELPKKNVC